MVGMGVTMKKTRLLSVAGRLATKEAVIWNIVIVTIIREGVEAHLTTCGKIGRNGSAQAHHWYNGCFVQAAKYRDVNPNKTC